MAEGRPAMAIPTPTSAPWITAVSPIPRKTARVSSTLCSASRAPVSSHSWRWERVMLRCEESHSRGAESQRNRVRSNVRPAALAGTIDSINASRFAACAETALDTSVTGTRKNVTATSIVSPLASALRPCSDSRARCCIGASRMAIRT